MFKKLIAPVQNILLSKGICPGCGRLLSSEKTRQSVSKVTERVRCRCKRVFVFDKKTQNYRRALFKEA